MGKYIHKLYIYIKTYSSLCICVNIYIYIYIHANVYVYIYIYMHIYLQRGVYNDRVKQNKKGAATEKKIQIHWEMNEEVNKHTQGF